MGPSPATKKLSPSAIKPNYYEAHNNLGLTLRDLGKLDGAVTSFHKALAIKPDYYEAHNNLGLTLRDLGKMDEAVTSFHKALAIKPDYIEAHNNLGVAHRELGNLDEAVASLQKALDIKPDYAEAHNNLGIAFKSLGRPDDAIASYYKSLAVKPNFISAHFNLIEVLENTNRTEALREAVAVAKINCVAHPRLSLGEARLLKRDGEYIAARAVLEATGEEFDDADFLTTRAHLLGELNDRIGDTEAAFNYFTEGNRRIRDTRAAKLVDGRDFPARIDVLEKRFTSDWVKSWRKSKSAGGPSGLVFLVGFPRSGTTLLDTILRSHGNIAVVEEIPATNLVREAFKRLPGNYPDGLAELEQTHLEELRHIYLAELDKHLEPECQSAVVIDKLPLNIVDAGLIHRIFPQARFLFVQRHPCDCVLSCFMQNFQINEAMANFLDLEDAARLYDRVMALWQKYLAVLPLEVHTVRYESLIEDFEETLTPLLGFLGVEWDSSVRNYTATAFRRDSIRTPSYNQVTQPLYTRARGRWEQYREHMRPVLPTLLPWVRRFGYGS
jgi:tetratricopeptide (TPR) repeat protein